MFKRYAIRDEHHLGALVGKRFGNATGQVPAKSAASGSPA